MFFLKIKLVCVVLLILVGCGGEKNNPSVVLIDEVLLSCLSDDFNQDGLIELIEFKCSDVDLSNANFSGLENIPKLEKIHLDNTKLVDLVGISKIQQITDLKIVNNYIKLDSGGSKELDISSITSLDKLKYLDLSYNYIPNLDSISSLVNLKSLTLNSINVGMVGGSTRKYYIDLSPLSTLTKLTSLSLEDNFTFGGGDGYKSAFTKADDEFSGFTGLSDLVSLTDLEYLDLSSSIYGEINNGGFPYFPKLLSLDLSENRNGRGVNGWSNERGITNITSLNKLTTLTHLDLHSNSIREVAPLASLTRLVSLDLSGNYYHNDIWNYYSNTKPISSSIIDVEEVAILSQLTFLNLSETSTADFSFLASLESLSSLSINNSYMKDGNVSDFPFLITLKYLSMKNNWLTSSDFLAMYDFKKLDLSHNCIADFSQVNSDELIINSQRLISNCNVLGY